MNNNNKKETQWYADSNIVSSSPKKGVKPPLSGEVYNTNAESISILNCTGEQLTKFVSCTDILLYGMVWPVMK